MAKKLKQIDELELVAFYENNEISVRNLSKKFEINSARSAEILRRYNSRKYKINSARHGHDEPWNKGKDKSDPRIAASIKKMSQARLKETKKDGYKSVFAEELGKAVKEHVYVWFKNTGHWPNSAAGEQVHHINGVKDDNRWENLYLTSVEGHTRIHKEYEEVCLRLLALGLISFDKENGSIDWNSFTEMVNKLKV